MISTSRLGVTEINTKSRSLRGILLADITGRTIETVNNTQEIGAIGTALVVAAGIKGADALELS